MTTREMLWQPSEERIRQSPMYSYQQWLADKKGVHTTGFAELHQWSVDNLDDFWESIWEYFDVVGTRGDGPVRTGDSFEETTWFPGASVNYAQNLLRHAHTMPDREAVVALHESDPRESYTWKELNGKVGALAAALRDMGVRPGDRVAAVLPNIAETIIALLASATVGAVWSVVNTDFGERGIADRFAQIEPKVLLTVDGFDFNGTYRNMLPQIESTLSVLPSVEHHILIDRHRDSHPDTYTDLPGQESTGTTTSVTHHRFSELTATPQDPVYEPVEFSHPLWILYSSGTTGKPKGIVHGHGGIVLDVYKMVGLHNGSDENTRLYFAVATTWMVWNLMVNVLALGSTTITYDGSPAYPSPARLFDIAESENVTEIGTGAALLSLIEKAGINPSESYKLPHLEHIMSTGSTLPGSTWRWAYEQVKHDFQLGSSSGGTDICSGILGANPFDPVYVNELQGKVLGVDAHAFNAQGESVIGEVGELVFTQPLPNMPVMFWNDPDGTKYHDAYFADFPGVWRHGDWATQLPEGPWIIHGRSDSTINRGGIRMGSADICDVVDQVPGVATSMVIGAEVGDGDYYMPLFVVPARGHTLDEDLKGAIVEAIRTKISPRYVPDELIEAPAVPRTRTGKLMEVPIKKIFQGADPSTINRTAAEDVATVDWYVDFARQRVQKNRD